MGQISIYCPSDPNTYGVGILGPCERDQCPYKRHPMEPRYGASSLSSVGTQEELAAHPQETDHLRLSIQNSWRQVFAAYTNAML